MTVGHDVVRVPREKLLLGFANGWADNEKFIRVEPEDAARVVEAAGLRGAMFWVIDEEGDDGDEESSDSDADVQARILGQATLLGRQETRKLLDEGSAALQRGESRTAILLFRKALELSLIHI